MQTMNDLDGLIWMDGKWLDWREAKIHVLTHSLHYGMGAFEGVRAYETPIGTAIFRLDEHTKRWLNSADILGMKMPFSASELNQIQREVVVKNHLKNAYIRPICFYGSEGMGLRADNLKVHTVVAAWDWGSYLGEEGMTNGIKIKTSSFTRSHSNNALVSAKITGNYINSMMALQEATAAGFDEALMLDTNGFVAEGSGENIFIIRDGVIETPDLTSALAGITRATICTIATDLGFKVIEKNLNIDDIYLADEAFFTGTAAEVTPVVQLDNTQIGDGKRGELTQKLQSAYFDCVHGRSEKYRLFIENGVCK